MTHRIDEFLSYVSRIMHLIDQGEITEDEIERIAMIFRDIVDNNHREKTLRLFTHALSTIPPPAPAQNIFAEERIIVEPEGAYEDRSSDETITLEVSPQQPPPQQPRPSTTYSFVDQSALRRSRRISRSNIIIDEKDLP